MEKVHFTIFFISVEKSRFGKVKASISQFKDKMLKMAKGQKEGYCANKKYHWKNHIRLIPKTTKQGGVCGIPWFERKGWVREAAKN